jgi:ribosome-associated protein
LTKGIAVKLPAKKKRQALPKEKLNALIIDALQDVKGLEITQIDLRHVDDAPVNYFIICHGTSHTQVAALGGRVMQRVAEELDLRPNHTEGKRNGTWVLVDFFDVVVHIFYQETRNYYRIDELWSDGVVTRYE